MKTFLELTTNHPEASQSTLQWRKRELISVRCPVCEKIGPDWYPKSIDVVLNEHPGYKVCCFVCISGFRIFHIDFIRQIRSHLESFIIGRCFLPNGELIEEYVTCYTNKWLVVRGSKGSHYRECINCGSISSVPIGSKYILKAYLTNALIYQDVLTTFYIDEELAKKLDFSPWPDAELEPIDIREEPIDGYYLPCDPLDAPWREKTSIYF